MNFSLAQTGVSHAGQIGLITGEALRCASCCHQFGILVSDVFENLQIQWAILGDQNSSLIAIAKSVCVGCVHE